MKTIRTLRWWSPLEHADKTRSTNVSRHCRHFSRVFAYQPRTVNLNKLPSLSRPVCFRLLDCSRHLTTHHALRSASTSSVVSSGLDASPVVDTAPVTAPTDDFLFSSFENLDIIDHPQVIFENLGFLKQLGLDYGWGPTTLVQNMLEFAHIYAGTPWWASIMLTGLLVRVVFFKIYLNATDASARMAVIKPYTEPISARLKAARATRDTDTIRQASGELGQLYKNADIKIWKLALPMLQVPLGYGSFRLLNGMAELPVPGLEDGGLLWLKDLTLSDPYFILPIGTGLGFYILFRSGGELGSNDVMSSRIRKIFLYVFPVFTTCFMLTLPAAAQISFAFTSTLGLAQAFLFRQPWFREFADLQPLPKPTVPSNASEAAYTGKMTIDVSPSRASEPSPPKVPKGVIAGAVSDVKGAASQLIKSARNLLATEDKNAKKQRRSPAELKRALAYEETRRREIEQEKLEASQEREWRRREENDARRRNR